jgi:hypothetical protein
MPVFAREDWMALIILSVTVEPDCDSTCIWNLVPLATPEPHCEEELPGLVQTMVPLCSVQPWLVRSVFAFEVENGYGLSFWAWETKSDDCACGIGP